MIGSFSVSYSKQNIKQNDPPAHFKGVSIDEKSSTGERLVAGEATLEFLRSRRTAIEQVTTAILENVITSLKTFGTLKF
jgi:hypothetical protein